MVIGGWALGFHGWPRNTNDLDVRVAVDPDNEKLVRRALAEFGAPELEDDFFSEESKNIFMMGRPPTKIEVISAIDGVKFDDCYLNAEAVQHTGVEFGIIGREDFIANKIASGRPKDLVDLEGIGEEID